MPISSGTGRADPPYIPPEQVEVKRWRVRRLFRGGHQPVRTRFEAKRLLTKQLSVNPRYPRNCPGHYVGRYISPTPPAPTPVAAGSAL